MAGDVRCMDMDAVMVIKVKGKEATGREDITDRLAEHTANNLLIILTSSSNNSTALDDHISSRVNMLDSNALSRKPADMVVVTAAATLMVVRAATVGHRPKHTAVGTIRVPEPLNDGVMAKFSRGGSKHTANSPLSEKDHMAVVKDKPCLIDVGLTTDQIENYVQECM